MLSENIAQDPVQENQDPGGETGNQHGDQANSLLEKEKDYAKKMRHRAQEAEKKLQSYEAEMNKQKEAQLAEQGKFREMYEDLKTKSSAWENDSIEYQKFMRAEKETLLSSLPEEDREVFKDLGLTQLKKVVGKVNVKTEAPKVVHGELNPNMTTNKTFNEMTDAERERWHQSVLNSKS